MKRTVNQAGKIAILKPASHSCFCYESDEFIVTVYSRGKKSLRLYEVNAALDVAKAKLIERMRGK